MANKSWLKPIKAPSIVLKILAGFFVTLGQNEPMYSRSVKNIEYEKTDISSNW